MPTPPPHCTEQQLFGTLRAIILTTIVCQLGKIVQKSRLFYPKHNIETVQAIEERHSRTQSQQTLPLRWWTWSLDERRIQQTFHSSRIRRIHVIQKCCTGEGLNGRVRHHDSFHYASWLSQLCIFQLNSNATRAPTIHIPVECMIANNFWT